MCSCLGLLNNAFCFSLCVMSGMRSSEYRVSFVIYLAERWNIYGYNGCIYKNMYRYRFVEHVCFRTV